MNVLITGGGGFIGSHLVDSQLSKGNYVRVLDLHFGLLDHVRDHPRLEIIQGDITNQSVLVSLVENIDIVYHLASAHLDVSLSDAYYEKVNLTATDNLTKAAQQAGIRRFVHCSSVGVIGDVDHPPADEESVCQPTNIYEKTKLAGERAVLAYQQETGYGVVVVRPAWVYGPRCPRTQKLLRTIRKGRFFFFGDGQNLRHPIYIDDCINGIELAASQAGIEGEIYILGGDVAVTTQELVTTAAKQLSVSPPTIRLPLVLGRLGGRLFQYGFRFLGKQPPFSERSLDFFTKNNAYRIDKARVELNFKPMTNLSTGLAETIRFQNSAS